MSNYKLISLLDASPLSDEDRHNIVTIFSALSPERQLDILGNWQRYLDKILVIHEQAESARKTAIKDTFDRINTLIDEAYLRDQAAKAKSLAEQAQRQADLRAALEYDERRRQMELEKIRADQEEARKKLTDPLAFL